MIVPIFVGALQGGIRDVLREVEWVYSELLETKPLIIRTVAEIQNIFLMDSDTIIWKALSRLLQTEERKMWN